MSAATTFPAWVPANRCTSGPRPGALALMRWFVESYGDKGGFNLGIFNCRTVRGGRTTSMHGEGRACDFGFPVGDPDGDRLLKLLLEHVGELGIQAIIYERRIYSSKSPKGRPYTGLVPHWDHLHVELTPRAAERLTYATVKAVLAEKVWTPGERSLQVGDRGNDVAWVQRKLVAHSPAGRRIVVDGIFGPATRNAVKHFELQQKARGYTRLVADGVVGPITVRALKDPKPPKPPKVTKPPAASPAAATR